MEDIKRPTEDESDDELLEQQRNFLKEIKKPAAKCVSYCRKPSDSSSPQENPKDTPDTEERVKKVTGKDIEVVSGDVIFDVKERDVSFNEPFVFQPPSQDPEEMSRKLKNLNVKLNEKRYKGKSIVALLTSSEKQNSSSERQECESFSMLVDGSGLQADSKEAEMKKIHEENLQKLSSMSKEEILRHQEQLKNYLKPEILDFIKKRKEKKKDDSGSNKMIRNKNESDLPGEILRKEGKEDCDALILEKVLESESNESPSQEIDASYNHEKDIEIPEEAKELIEGTKKGLWRNMNKIEKEKLEWMTNLPQPKPVDSKTGYTARFDFEGKLLSREADIPTYEGLHHHGKEPEVPGYSLEELFLLARSSLQSQRITALNTIAHILENNWCGMMDKCFDAPLLPLLLNGGIVPLLRWALDDISLTSISATISAIHSLLISKADEACSNKTFCWLNGHFVAQLEPQGLDEPNIVIEELTDADLIKLDVVKGFLRIDILPRFMYILKVMCPPPLVCKLIIEICARLAQHSPESAKQVATYPGLLYLIFEKFLPLNWKFTDSSTLTDTVGYSCPMHSALKLLRIIVSSSKNLALYLVDKYDVVPIITFYLTVQPCDGKLPPQEVQLLVIETLKLWHSFLCYGLAINMCLDLFPILLKQLEFCLSLNLNCDIRDHIHDFEYATHLLKAFEAVTILASEKDYEGQFSTAIFYIFKQASLCLRKWIWQFSHDISSSHGITLLAACMNFIVTHCKRPHERLIDENWKPCSSAKEIFEECLLPAMKSNIFQNLLTDFRSFSLYLKAEITGNKRDGKTIVSLGSVLYEEDIVPILKEGSPLPLLSAVLNYILFYKNSFQDSENECIEIVLCPPVLDYLKAVSKKKLNECCWFLKFERYFIYQLVQLTSIFVSKDASLCHETALSILPTFTLTEEYIVEDLFKNVIFNQPTIPRLASVLQSSESEETNSLHLLAPILPVLAQCYVSCFLDKMAISISKNMLLGNSDIDCLFCLSTQSSLIPKDWCFMPIFYLYQKAKKRKKEECLSPEEALQVISSLQWIAICHMLNLPVLKDIPGSAEFYYLCSVFLLDENLFRDQRVKDLLVHCLSLIYKQKTIKLAKINCNDIKTFEDIYLEMLIQYDAVSYGDDTFGSFLVLPLQQCYPKEWKKLLLTEHLSVLRFLKISLQNLLVPIQNFLEPAETDIKLLSDYFKALASGSLDYRRCPLLHLMAVHHINNFVFTKSKSYMNDQKHLLLNILKSKKDLQKKILLYLEVNVTSEYGFNMADELSSERKKHISDITGHTVKL